MDILTIADGEQITAPGAYRVGMEHYHSQAICPGPSVSSTGIRKAENESEWAFWATCPWNPNAYPVPTNDAFSFGSAAHSLILGDEVFADHYAVLPFDSLRTKAAKEWKDEQIASGKAVISAEDVTKIGYMAENLRKVPLVQAGILDGIAEVSLIWKDEETGLWVKARPDIIQLNGQVVGDLKTCASASVIDCHRSITKYAYHQQLALGIEGIERIFGVTATDAVIVFSEKSSPYHAQPIILDEDCLYWARQQNRRGLRKIAAMVDTPPRPVYDDTEVKYSLPPSFRERLSEQQLSGELPNV